VDADMTIAEIAEAVDRCKTTVRYWLRRYGLRTRGKRRRAELAAGTALEGPVILSTCKYHGTTEFVLESRGYRRCKRCRSERVTNRRRVLKATLVKEAGGRCALCGYDKYVGALEFHHIDPSLKRQPVSNGRTIALDALRAEAQKCLLLCSNCHAEVEGGVAQVPLQFVDDRDGVDAVGPSIHPLPSSDSP
jgi:hypothetical protein